jgi:uncharacterized protein YndB with AHSA1/START domain
MAPIVSTIEVARPATEVFSYVTDPARFAEWQENVTGGHMYGDGPPGVGDKCITTRRIGFVERPATSEVTDISPPRSWAIRAIVNVTVRSRVTIELDFEGHGIGKLLVPLAVRRDARKEMPRNLRKLKDRLENPDGH